MKISPFPRRLQSGVIYYAPGSSCGRSWQKISFCDEPTESDLYKKPYKYHAAKHAPHWPDHLGVWRCCHCVKVNETETVPFDRPESCACDPCRPLFFANALEVLLVCQVVQIQSVFPICRPVALTHRVLLRSCVWTYLCYPQALSPDKRGVKKYVPGQGYACRKQEDGLHHEFKSEAGHNPVFFKGLDHPGHVKDRQDDTMG